MKQGRFVQNDFQTTRAVLRHGVNHVVKCVVRFLPRKVRVKMTITQPHRDWGFTFNIQMGLTLILKNSKLALFKNLNNTQAGYYGI